MSLFTDVGLFHYKFDLPISKANAGGNRAPQLMDPGEFAYRLRFLQEELIEFSSCHMKQDLAGAADGLVDLIWVALGTAHYMGLPFDQLWKEVRRANMEKILRGSGDVSHKRGVAETIRKPMDWKEPNIEGILKEHMKND